MESAQHNNQDGKYPGQGCTRRSFLAAAALGISTSSFLPVFPANSAGQTQDDIGSAVDAVWRQKKELAPFYTHLATYFTKGKPLIIATYAGLWFGGDPEHNLHWGSYYGPFRMFERSREDKQIAGNYAFSSWKREKLQKKETDPVRTAVYSMRVQPNKFWQDIGVHAPFTVYQVFQVYSDLRQAAIDMALNLKASKGENILLEDKVIDLGRDAQVIGYNGHNFYYDGPFSGLKHIQSVPEREKGVFVIGCNTKRFFRDDCVGRNIYGLAFTTSFMAPEGYNLLALADGIAQGMDGRQLAQYMDNKYRYFQVLGGQAAPGPLFVNHGHKLF